MRWFNAKSIACVFLVALALAASWARRGGPDQCTFDGLPIEDRYRVRIVAADNAPRLFCCVRCAESWLAKANDAPHSIFVTDEHSGQELAAAAAHYARSTVVTNRASGNRIHVFRTAEAAARHAEAFRGSVIDPPSAPFFAFESSGPSRSAAAKRRTNVWEN